MIEVLSSNPLLKDFVKTSRQNSFLETDRTKTDKEHREISTFLYDAGKKLLDRYGEEKAKRIAVGAGKGIFGMHFETVSLRSTPMISIETNDGQTLLTVEEGVTTGSNYYKSIDRIEVNVFSNVKWINLLNISQTRKETKNWLNKKATLEQMKNGRRLLTEIKNSLREEYGDKINEVGLRKEEDASNICGLN